MVAAGGFKGRDDFNGAGQQSALAFQLADERIGSDDLGCGFQPADYHAGDARPDCRSQICQHQLRVNLDEYLSAAGFDSVQGGGYAFAGGRFVLLGHELGQVENHHVGSGLGGAGDTGRIGSGDYQPGTSDFVLHRHNVM